ncbi:MAG TPA: RNA ligase family protein [Legionellaceae bacterium]|nr:RNA ligase family protein [Legionellaceae bacterium]
MSYFSVDVFKIENMVKHSNADTLSIIETFGCPVIVRTQDFAVGDMAIYIPVESLIPEDKEWVKTHCGHLKFKNGVHRVKAVRLRGVFSMGMVVPISALGPGPTPGHGPYGTDVSQILGITKYEEPEDRIHVQEPPKPKTLWGRFKKWLKHLLGIKPPKPTPRVMPVYEVDHYRKLKSVLELNEPVIITEKVHGTNFAACYYNNKFIVSSHRVVRNTPDDSFYWRAARQYDLENKLKAYPELAFFGEIYGPQVQDMGYGLKDGEIKLAFFDIMHINNRQFLNYDDKMKILNDLGLDSVPLIYRGPYVPETVEPLVEGPSLIPGANHNREGFVIQPELERINPRCGRIKLKFVSEWYMLRKGGTERH